MRRLYRVFVLYPALLGSAMFVGCANFQVLPPSESPTANSSTEPSSTDAVLRSSTAWPSEQDTRKDADGAFQLSDLSPSNIGDTIKELSGNGPDQRRAEQLYQEAESLYDEAIAARAEDMDDETRDLFLKAGDKYAAAAARWPDSALEEDALFRAGESLFFADRYVQSNERFEELLEKYPNSRYLDLMGARRFKIARYWVDLDTEDGTPLVSFHVGNKRRPWSDTFGHAIRIYDRMRLDDPTGKLADDATIAAANAYFARRNFVDADQYYTDLRRNFPSSEHQFMAHYLGIQAKLRGYRGPEYAGEVLDEAEKLVRQIRRQFPREYRKREEDVERAYREVRYRQAEREWHLAKYYHRRHQYGAARLYYNLILRQFPDTPFAEKARANLAETDGKPRTPPQRFAWLVNLFPDGNRSLPETSTSGGNTKQR